MDKKFILLSLIVISLIISLNVYSGKPPKTIVFTGDRGIEIEYPQKYYFEKDKAHTFRSIPYNKSNGLEFTNDTADCYLFVLGIDGTMWLESKMDYNDMCFYKELSKSNFTDLGKFTYCIRCNTSSIGGFVSTEAEITTGFKLLELKDALMLMFVIVFVMSLIYFSYKLTLTKPDRNYNNLVRAKLSDNLDYYVKLLSNHVYLIGYFGMYIFSLTLVALMNYTLYSLNLIEIGEFFKQATILMGWGLIPFTIFWFIWLSIQIYKLTTEVLKRQIGGFGRNERK